MGFEIGVPGAVTAFLGLLVSATGRLALPAALLAILTLWVALCVALWLRLRRLSRTLDALAASVKKALEAQRTPAPPPSPAPRVRYTKRGVPYQWDPVHGSRFVKKART
jgi:membrane protein implicated in regulation of membrane protease activity